MRAYCPSEKQHQRAVAYRGFLSRLPVSSRDGEIWSRYLHLIRSAYQSPFCALVSIDGDRLHVIDWVDSRLDGSFPELVEALEREFRLNEIRSHPTRPVSALIFENWLMIELSFFSDEPAIGVAVFVSDARNRVLNTATIHSFEKVVSASLESPHHHESARAQLSWSDQLSGDELPSRAGVNALDIKQ